MQSPEFGPLKPPSFLNTVKEIRAVYEWLFVLFNKFRLSNVPRGSGKAIVLVPGYGFGKWTLRPLKLFLQSINYQVYDWGQGRNLSRNHGEVKEDTELLAQRIADICNDHNHQAVAVIGWSLGGILARKVARLKPLLVKEIIVLGAPIHGGPKYTVFAKVYAKSSSEKSVQKNLNDYDKKLQLNNQQEITQPQTVIYSQSDGIVGWRATLDYHNENARNVAVNSSHLGMGVSKEVWQVIAEALAQSKNNK